MMDLATVDKIAKAVLYEGYMLYPYRPSSVKNQQRWNFGVLCPQSYSESPKGSEAWAMQTEVLIQGGPITGIEVRIRFLGDEARIARLSLIDESGDRFVRMAHLACVGSHAINGVAELHSQLIKQNLLKPLDET